MPFEDHNHFSELNEPLFGGSGVMSPDERKARARANLGISDEASGSARSASVSSVISVSGLTDKSGGEVLSELPEITNRYNQKDVANAIATLTAKVNELIAALVDKAADAVTDVGVERNTTVMAAEQPAEPVNEEVAKANAEADAEAQAQNEAAKAEAQALAEAKAAKQAEAEKAEKSSKK